MIFTNAANALSEYIANIEAIVSRINARIQKFDDFQSISTDTANSIIQKADGLNLLSLTTEMLSCMACIQISSIKETAIPDSDFIQNDVIYLIGGSDTYNIGVDSDNFTERMAIVSFRTDSDFTGTLTINTIDNGFYNPHDDASTSSLVLTEPNKTYSLVLLRNSSLTHDNSWFLFEPPAMYIPHSSAPFYVENGYGRAYSTGDGVIQMDGFVSPDAKKHPWPIAIDNNEFKLCSFIAGTPFNPSNGLLEYGNDKANAISVTTFNNSLSPAYTGASNVKFDPIFKDDKIFVYGPGNATSSSVNRPFYLTIYGSTGTLLKATQTLTQSITLPGVGFSNASNFWEFSGGTMCDDQNNYYIVAFYNFRYYGVDGFYYDTFMTVKITINKTTLDASVACTPHPYEFRTYDMSVGCAFGKTNTIYSNGGSIPELTFLYAMPYIDGVNHRTAIYGYYPFRNALSLLLLSPIHSYSSSVFKSVYAESFIEDDMTNFNSVRFLRSDLSSYAYIENFNGDWVKLPSVPSAPYVGFDGNRSFIHNTGIHTPTTESPSSIYKEELSTDLAFAGMRIVNGVPLLVSTKRGVVLDSNYDLMITVNGQYIYDSVNDSVYRETPIASAYINFSFVEQPKIVTNLIHDDNITIGKNYYNAYDFQVIKLDMGAQQVIPWKATFAKVNL